MLRARVQGDGRRGTIGWVVGPLTRPSVDGFGQTSGEDFHNAVGVGVVVNWGTFSGSPDEDELRIPASDCGLMGSRYRKVQQDIPNYSCRFLGRPNYECSLCWDLFGHVQSIIHLLTLLTDEIRGREES